MDTPPDIRPLDFDEYTIATPENVTFGYQVAGIGSRFIGALIDTLLIVFLLFLLNLLVGLALGYVTENSAPVNDFADDPGWLAGLVIALYTLLNFAIFWGYYIVFELGWHGQTPGKRVAGTCVVKLDGAGPGFLEVAIRNLVRLVDFLPVAYAVGFVVMFFNRNARRLGDYAAGTLVVRQSDALQLDAITGAASSQSAPQPARAMPQTPTAVNAPPPIPNIRRLTGDDYQLICATLDRQRRGRADPSLVQRLANAVAAKLETPMPGPTWRDAQLFLCTVVETYQQAARLS